MIVCCKDSTSHDEGLSTKIACHTIQWLQFAIRHIGELQSWHSSRHFRIPIAPAISTLQLGLGTLGQRSSLNCGAVQTEVEATISLSSVRLNPIMCY